jgi:superfamily II RNA helicase
MLYQSPGSLEEGSRLENVTTVVLDEVHYLSDISRGTVWEETVIYCPKGVQLICLSATVANPEDLAGWIAQVHGPTELVTGTRRPVPLKWHFSTRYELRPLLNEQGTAMNYRLALQNSSQRSSSSDSFEDYDERGRRRGQTKKRLTRNSSNNSNGRPNEGRSERWRGNGWEEPEEQRMSEEEVQFIRRRQVPQVRDTLTQLVVRDMLPAIWFIFSRRGCDTAVKYLQDENLLSLEESRQVKEAIAKFQAEHPDSVRDTAVEPLSRGVAAHHAGCLPTWKAFVEELFQRGLVKVVFATETLAAGINMPARTAVLSTISKRGDVGHNLLSANSMLQMAGRAGRRGIDEQGHVVVVQTAFEGAEECCKILFAGVDPLVSQFTATYGMAINLLAGGKVPKSVNPAVGDLPAVPFGRTVDEAKELIEQSFANYIGSEVIHAARKQVEKLEDEVERLVQKAQVESSSQVLESRLTKSEFREYNELRELVKEQKAIYQKMVFDLEAAKAEASSDISPHSGVPMPEVLAAETLVAEKKKEISILRKNLKRTLGYKEKHQLVVLQKSRLEKIARLQDKIVRMTSRIRQMAPSGWKEFLQIAEVLNAVGAVNMETSELLPLGQTTSAVRGENELWLALVFSNAAVLSLNSAQLAAACGSLVSEGLKTRSEDGSSTLYEVSQPVVDWMITMESIADWFVQLQCEHAVNIPCHIDITYAGMVEAWAAGVTWKELMQDSGMDEGDVARVLRRSIDLLAQIPHMPHIHPDLAKLASQTQKVMDRPPISELLG